MFVLRQAHACAVSVSTIKSYTYELLNNEMRSFNIKYSLGTENV